MSESEWNSQLDKLAENIVIPKEGSHIWKEECAFSFATPFSPNGLFLNLQSFQSFSEAFIGLDHDRTGNKLYLNMRFKAIKKKIEKEEKEKRLEIVVDELVNIEKEYYLCIYPDTKIEQLLKLRVVEGNNFSVRAFSKIEIPMNIQLVLEEVITRADRSKETDIKNWSAAEEEDKRPISKFVVDMFQVDNPPQISQDPSTWKCQESGMTENLWLNLHDGYIGSGRKNWDGSGGTGAALTHYNETGKKYPLCVKLGTITPDGEADIYSYDASEDCMVKDPYLPYHLSHFGLDIKKMKKTDKTLLELELDLNQKHIFSAITESEKQLVPKYGPGFVGLKNLGNTCYMNSVIQVLFKLEPFQKRFFYGNSAEVRKCRLDRFMKAVQEPQVDRELQMIKLASALSDPESEYNDNLRGQIGVEEGAVGLRVPPKLLKDSFCSTHPEFKKQAQQDSQEFLEYFLGQLSDIDTGRSVQGLGLEGILTNNDLNPGKWFEYVLEERLLCNQSKMVRYKQINSPILSLNVPISLHELNKVIEANKKPGKDIFLPTIDFEACLDNSLGESEQARSVMTDYLSPATGIKGVAFQTSGMKTFPKFLCVHLRRYVVSEIDMSVHKLTCLIPAPLKLDLSRFKSNGLKEGEYLLPELEEPAVNSTNDFESKVTQLMAMSFPENMCRHALLNNNGNPDLAVGWIFENINNPIYALPPEMPKEAAAKKTIGKDEILARVKQIQEENNGEGTYKLRGFVSHMGSNTASGHYVCHVFDEELQKWIIYNDEKVAVSEEPPLAHGYLYFYERLD